MRQFLKFAVALAIAVAVVMAVRAFAFTIYTAPLPIGKQLRGGDKVAVNKLSRCRDLQRGDMVVFAVSGEAPRFAIVGPPQELGVVIGVPGDTVAVGGQRYRIPYKCCDRCQCNDCRLYLVDTGLRRCLVHKHQMAGKAWRLFH